MKLPRFVLSCALLLLLSGCSAEADNSSTSSSSTPASGRPSDTPATATPAPTAPTPVTGKVRVVLKTSMGSITLELDADKAPLSVANFLQYADDKHYDGTVFHRVLKNFMIQGGGFDTQRMQKPTRAPIKNEAQNGLRNLRGTIAMARTGAVDSATAQFFINHKDNAFLDHGVRDFGYAVFGRVVEGMAVVDAIANLPQQNLGGAFATATQPLVVINTVERLP